MDILDQCYSNMSPQEIRKGETICIVCREETRELFILSKDTVCPKIIVCAHKECLPKYTGDLTDGGNLRTPKLIK